jgi:opacity protein-like surface antigen
MKRILVAAAAAASMSGVAVAQVQNPDAEDRAEKGIVPTNPTVGGAGTPGAGTANTTVQSADPEQTARRRATINQPTGAGSNAGSAVNTTVQPADPEESAKKRATINQPSGAGGTAIR